VPANSPKTEGFIDVFDPSTMRLVDTFPVPGCENGPTGLALGPNQKFLGACDNAAASVEVRHGQLHKLLPQVAGADEIWFNPGDDNFYLGIGGPPAKLGVVNANDDHVVGYPCSAEKAATRSLPMRAITSSSIRTAPGLESTSS